jgi:hypothetical protein
MQILLMFHAAFQCVSLLSFLLKIVIPNESKRLDYLTPMGVNYRELEGDFF